MQCVFNDNIQLALFSWEEFCGDTSLEKAGWFVEPTADYVSDSSNQNTDFNQEICLNFLRFNYHPVGSPKGNELQPPFRSKRLTTRYSLLYSILWSISALYNFIWQLFNLNTLGRTYGK
jgi:midasin